MARAGREKNAVRVVSACALLVLSVAGAAPAFAEGTDSFRCGSQIIEVGAPASKVRDACGDPDDIDGYDWTYERGSGQFTIIVHMAPDNTVSSIDQDQPE